MCHAGPRPGIFVIFGFYSTIIFESLYFRDSRYFAVTKFWNDKYCKANI